MNSPLSLLRFHGNYFSKTSKCPFWIRFNQTFFKNRTKNSWNSELIREKKKYIYPHLCVIKRWKENWTWKNNKQLRSINATCEQIKKITHTHKQSSWKKLRTVFLATQYDKMIFDTTCSGRVLRGKNKKKTIIIINYSVQFYDTSMSLS